MATRLGLFETNLYFLGTVIIGVFLFTYGFFPLNVSSEETSSKDDIPLFLDDILLDGTKYKRQISKIVLMIVDALKYDFSYQMPFTQTIQKQGKICTFKMKIEVPTVTMPRIKSITTGSISNFIDVVINLGSRELLIDSIIYQMHKRGDKINFYGDNTWTNLFPNMFFRKQENFDSFYVNDFYNGDNNITRNVLFDLKHLNWDMLILHYLGLDHIGHVEGSKSPKIYNKLIEMDEIIQKIYTSLPQKDENNLSNILIVTADHGMHDSGGHGGGSDSEIFIPFIWFQEKCNNFRDDKYNQIDIAPTLAILLGFPIPDASIGNIIRNMINFLSQEEQLFGLYYNTLHLKMKAEKCLSRKQEDNYLELYRSAKKFHKDFIRSIVKNQSSDFLFENAMMKYLKTSDIISQLLVSAYTKFDLQYIFLGLILSSFGTISFMIIVFQDKRKISSEVGYQNSWLSIVPIIFFTILLTTRMESGTSIHWFTIIVIVIYFMLTIKINLNIYRSFKLTIQRPNYLVISIIIPIISLTSSSFIEEEHQLWYYIGMTILLYLAQNEIYAILKKIEINDFNILRGNFKKSSNIINLLKRKEAKKIIASLRKWCCLFIMHIFARRLNQTGDKWLHLEDIGDWLSLENNKLYLSIILLKGLFMSMITLKNYNRFLTNFMFIMSIISIHQYRCAVESVELFHIKYISSNIALFIFVLNVFGIILINYGYTFYKQFTNSHPLLMYIKEIINSKIMIFVLVSLLLHKPYNVILIPSCIVTLNIVFESSDKYLLTMDRFMCKTILCIWVGKMFYFYQGNSNSLATIDLNSGYLFLNTYNPFIVGFFVTLNTYGGPICSFLILLREIFNTNDIKIVQKLLHNTFRLYVLITTFRINFYLIILYMFRQHLFIWTVFSPKFLYELYEFFLFIIITIFYSIYFKILRVF